ncbi:hypothetical protein BDN72DRAFT_859158 [Pluteus cervinus]|uniref:Uncharacterized protein n=1 Tax=Pluteus cervinus TaxID=181527 RepID=A0ACD3AQ41_9AGAR|nr:hypothetical protein BDN72DRAFT_859158 [Pluteus cervinus]
MSNSTFECGFSSLNDVLNQAATHDTNITELVQSCQSICNLVWGTGNPDLSGIGANISYILQFVLIIIFGPIFLLVYGMRDRLGDYLNKRWGVDKEKIVVWVAEFVQLQDTFTDASAQFTISVSVAMIVRIKQGAPLYEITFLHALTSMQFLGLLSVLVASAATAKEKTGRRAALLILYGLVDFGFYMGLVGFLRTSKASWSHIQELGTACEGYGTILPGFTYAKSANFPNMSVNWKSDFNPHHFAHNLEIMGIVVGFILAGALGVCLTALICKGLYEVFRAANTAWLGFISFGFTPGVLFFLVEMERTRSVMRSLTGSEFQDNQWGFGQVVSLFLWIPLVIQIFFVRYRGAGASARY